MKALILLTTAALLPSCTMTVSEGGAKSFSLDGPQALKAIEIFTNK